jgi:hypothetical protein
MTKNSTKKKPGPDREMTFYLANDLANAYRDARIFGEERMADCVAEREGNLLRHIRASVRTPEQIAEDKAKCDAFNRIPLHVFRFDTPEGGGK